MNCVLFLCIFGSVWMSAAASSNRTKCLHAHNVLRRLHKNTPDLVWDETLAKKAQSWATKLANNSKLNYTEKKGEGQNVYHFKGKILATCASAILAWYNEKRDYSYTSPGFNGANGPTDRFTQLVWKSTTKVGVGIASTSPTDLGLMETYIVARYSPQGNKYTYGHEEDDFRANVQPTKANATAPTVFKIDPSMCRDNGGSHCKMWKQSNLCKDEPAMMELNCPKTCKLC